MMRHRTRAALALTLATLAGLTLAGGPLPPAAAAGKELVVGFLGDVTF